MGPILPKSAAVMPSKAKCGGSHEHKEWQKRQPIEQREEADDDDAAYFDPACPRHQFPQGECGLRMLGMFHFSPTRWQLLSKAKVHGWDDHHVERRGREQAKEDDDGHGRLDLATRLTQA